MRRGTVFRSIRDDDDERCVAPGAGAIHREAIAMEPHGNNFSVIVQYTLIFHTHSTRRRGVFTINARFVGRDTRRLTANFRIASSRPRRERARL